MNRGSASLFGGQRAHQERFEPQPSYQQDLLTVWGMTPGGLAALGYSSEQAVAVFDKRCPGFRILHEEWVRHTNHATASRHLPPNSNSEDFHLPYTLYQQTVSRVLGPEVLTHYLQGGRIIADFVQDFECQHPTSRHFYAQLERLRIDAKKSSKVRAALELTTPYQQAVLNDQGISAQDVVEAGFSVEEAVGSHERENSGFRKGFEQSERNRTGAQHASRANRVRSRSRSPDSRRKSAARRTRSPARSSAPALRSATALHGVSAQTAAQASKEDTSPREELRNVLRKYKIGLEAVEAGGESVSEVMSQIERREERRARNNRQKEIQNHEHNIDTPEGQSQRLVLGKTSHQHVDASTEEPRIPGSWIETPEEREIAALTPQPPLAAVTDESTETPVTDSADQAEERPRRKGYVDNDAGPFVPETPDVDPKTARKQSDHVCDMLSRLHPHGSEMAETLRGPHRSSLSLVERVIDENIRLKQAWSDEQAVANEDIVSDALPNTADNDQAGLGTTRPSLRKRSAPVYTQQNPDDDALSTTSSEVVIVSRRAHKRRRTEVSRPRQTLSQPHQAQGGADQDAVALATVMDRLQFYRPANDGQGTRHPLSELHPAVRSDLERFLQYYAKPKYFEKLCLQPKSAGKSTCARRRVANRSAYVDDLLETCDHCLQNSVPCVQLNAAHAPTLVPVPADLRVGKYEDQPEFWIPGQHIFSTEERS